MMYLTTSCTFKACVRHTFYQMFCRKKHDVWTINILFYLGVLQVTRYYVLVIKKSPAMK